jgi:hypothetical protein
MQYRFCRWRGSWRGHLHLRAHAAPGTYLTAIYLMGESSSLDSLFNPDPIVGLHPLLPVPFLYRLY